MLVKAIAALGITVAASLTAGEHQRSERAITVASERYDEWLGRATPADLTVPITRAWWPSPFSMDLESQIAFQLARHRLSRIEPGPLLDGIAWHLQARVVEELFDLTYRRPGHHAEELRLLGNHVRWGIPLLVLSREARDARPPAPVSRAAAAVATLEARVGWPALAAALTVVAADRRPRLDAAAVKQLLESALAVPLDWFFVAVDSGLVVNYSLQSVTTRRQQCDDQPCHETTITVARDGPPPFPVPLVIEFGADQRSTLWWNGSEPSRDFAFTSSLAPSAITIDPGRQVRLDDNRLDQRWMAEPREAGRPVRALVSWMIWLQNAVLTYGVLL